ncbi:hypothetical protein BaRGS_00029729, partial [Batillaria attramentaria]
MQSVQKQDVGLLLNPLTLAAAKDTIKFCVHRSLQVVEYFGRPKSQDTAFENSWVQYKGKWKGIYSQSPVEQKKHVPGEVCAKWTDSVESLCTALTTSADWPSTSQQTDQDELSESSTELLSTSQQP